jgi:carboxyl-terminal processing protease
MLPKKRMVNYLIPLLALATCLALVVSPTSHPLAKVPQDAFEKLKVFSEILSLIDNNYVEPVDSEKLVYGAIRGMLKELDPHSAFMTPDMFKEMQVDTKGEFGGLGITIGLKNDVLTVIAPIEDTPAWKIGIKAGDQIIKVDDAPTRDMSVEDAVKKMRGIPGTSVKLHLLREGFTEPREFTIVRDIIKLKSVKHRMVDEAIALIRLTSFQERTSQDLLAALDEVKSKSKGLQGIILDLRNNPGGLLDQAVKVSSEFLPSSVVVVSTKGRKTNQNMEFKSLGGDRAPGVPIVVLVNQGSASASEIVAGALQDWNRALIIGTKTFGKGSVQTVVPLEDGSGLRLTTAKYYTPKGRSIQNTGIVPDLEIAQATVTPVNPPKEMHPKEQDLPGHLTNEQSPKPPDSKEPPKEGEEISDKDDYQLQRSVEIIKSWRLFQKITAVPAPSTP